MKKLVIPFILLLAACQQQEGQQDGAAANAAAPAPKTGATPTQPPRIGSLVGLYEGGNSEPRHQMCVVEGEGDQERFGLVIWGGNLHSCSGAGTVSRDGSRLRLAMAGDSACTIEATISGNSIRFPEQTPEGCAYYCGARAGFAGAVLTQTGTSQADAMKAKDLVGDPLCGGEG